MEALSILGLVFVIVLGGFGLFAAVMAIRAMISEQQEAEQELKTFEKELEQASQEQLKDWYNRYQRGIGELAEEKFQLVKDEMSKRVVRSYER